MIFSSIEFFIFFAIVLLLMILIRANNIKRAILLVASYYFYAYWDYRFSFLMLAMTLVNYYVGLKIEGSPNSKSKNTWLTGGVVFNLSVLGFFKYFNFFIGSLNVVLNNFNVKLPFLEIILPIGISFITFEVMSYIIDIYRGVNKSAKSFWDFALLVAFFPHLIAGPILKPKQFLPEIEKEVVIKWKNISYGMQIFLLGLVRKVVIADRLAMFVDPVFKTPQDYSSITIWLAVVAYAMQIYCDFCGYTDMAIGVAKCLGFDVPKNFDVPYISLSVTEFWRRWHISLSNWLRDYLYISLGGNRKGKIRQYCNLLIVMLLGGLWHGASWNFVVWGGLHGVALAIHKIYLDLVGKKPKNQQSYLYSFGAWLLTIIVVLVTWVFFRATDFSISSLMVQKMFYLTNSEGINWFASSLTLTVPILIICDYVGTQLNKGVRLQLSTFRGLFVMFFVMLGLLFLAPQNPSPFIYFQF
ncbi:MBOAT family O-acyltransferase [Aerosakkonema funiforme]|uniref:MBOAT family O-acyltransferase n=1 Tax=Aerosakkonema funiforme TaxID=1246630 RepID=UPI0035BC2F0D